MTDDVQQQQEQERTGQASPSGTEDLPNHRQDADDESVPRRIGRGLLAVFGGIMGFVLGILGLAAVMMAALLPFFAGSTNGVHDEHPMVFIIPVELAYMLVGVAIFAYRVHRQRKNGHATAKTVDRPVPTHVRGGSPRSSSASRILIRQIGKGSILVTLIAVVCLAYGLIWGGSDVIAVLRGPVGVSVARPRIEQRTVKNTDEYDEGTHQECTVVFDADGRQLRFDSGNCMGGELDAGNRIGQALDHIRGERVILRYYDTIHGPVFYSIEPDSRYS